MLTVEVSVLPGKGKLLLTGKLGDVMQESGQAALSYIRSNAKRLGVKTDFYDKMDVHVHIPEGSIPKDGPSAGVAMAVAIVSALKGIPTRNDVAMTGEITLRGKVLAVGGLSEKTVAALRNGLKTVLVPKANEKHLSELPEQVKKNLKVVTTESMDEVLRLALVDWEPPAEGPGEPAASGENEADGLSTFC